MFWGQNFLELSSKTLLQQLQNFQNQYQEKWLNTCWVSFWIIAMLRCFFKKKFSYLCFIELSYINLRSVVGNLIILFHFIQFWYLFIFLLNLQSFISFITCLDETGLLTTGFIPTHLKKKKDVAIIADARNGSSSNSWNR